MKWRSIRKYFFLVFLFSVFDSHAEKYKILATGQEQEPVTASIDVKDEGGEKIEFLCDGSHLATFTRKIKDDEPFSEKGVPVYQEKTEGDKIEDLLILTWESHKNLYEYYKAACQKKRGKNKGKKLPLVSFIAQGEVETLRVQKVELQSPQQLTPVREYQDAKKLIFECVPKADPAREEITLTLIINSLEEPSIKVERVSKKESETYLPCTLQLESASFQKEPAEGENQAATPEDKSAPKLDRLYSDIEPDNVDNPWESGKEKIDDKAVSPPRSETPMSDTNNDREATTPLYSPTPSQTSHSEKSWGSQTPVRDETDQRSLDGEIEFPLTPGVPVSPSPDITMPHQSANPSHMKTRKRVHSSSSESEEGEKDSKEKQAKEESPHSGGQAPLRYFNKTPESQGT